ncbi:restriction endonuclease [Roseateles sp. DC23W]|uniref:Restriction endonuclease n=1 Tax=Pelomonas dachongensis TaxID=3299029 RepID=A0ABW7EFR2_9BURK
MARRRNRDSVAEDIMSLVSKLPWWVGVLLAAASYAALHRVSQQPVAQPTQLGLLGATVVETMWRTLAFYGQYLLPLLCLIGALISAIKRRSRTRLLDRTTSNPAADALNGMSWQQFERLVGEGFRRQGYRVTETGQIGPDGGVDLELRKDAELHLVQCKQWRAQRVGVAVVRELYGAMAARGAAGGFVVTSGRFTQEAADFADGRNVRLIDGDGLKVLLAAGRMPPVAPVRPRAEPPCPLCGKGMVLRAAKRGAQVGNRFWGCSAFPGCRGTRDAPSDAAA